MGVKDVMSRQMNMSMISSAMWQTYYPFVSHTLAFSTKRVVTESFPCNSSLLMYYHHLCSRH